MCFFLLKIFITKGRRYKLEKYFNKKINACELYENNNSYIKINLRNVCFFLLNEQVCLLNTIYFRFFHLLPTKQVVPMT